MSTVVLSVYSPVEKMHEFGDATPGFELCSGSSVCYHGRKRWHAGAMGHQLWRNEAWVELLPLQKSGTKQKARQELGTWKISHIFGGRFNKRYWGVQVFKEASRIMTVLSPKSLSVPSLIEKPCSYCLLCWVTYFSCWKVVEVPSLRWIMLSLWRLAFCQGTELVVELQVATKRIWNLSFFGTKNLTSRTTCRYKN